MKPGTKRARPRIGFDLHILEGLHQGARTHCLELFPRVIRLLPEFDFTSLVDTTRIMPEHAEAFTAPNARVVNMEHKSSILRLTSQLPKLVHREGIDLLHLQYIRPLHLTAHTAVSTHDILFEEYPQYFETMMRIRSKILFRFSARTSDLVFTGSEHAKKEISERYGVPAGRITMVYNGADPARLHPGTEGSDQLSQLGLSPGEYLLSVGRLEPRKNYRGLLKAISMLPRPRPKLVVVGPPDFGAKEIYQCRLELQLQNDVVFLESVDDDLLGALYRNAKLFVYPSFAEGFGMPIVEAMASGIPVITSNTTSMPEVAGDAALLIDPHQPITIRDAIVSVLSDASLAHGMRKAGLHRAKIFDWNVSAEIVARKYREFFAGG